MFRRIIMREVKRQRLSGYRLAKLSGVAMRTVQDYLAGESDMNGERLGKLAHALGLQLRPVKRPRKGKDHGKATTR